MNATNTMDADSAALAAVYRRLYLKGKRAEQAAREAQEKRQEQGTKEQGNE